MPITTLEILKQALIEAAKPGYHQRTDRLLSAFDEARMSISPPAGRTPQRHDELMEACRAAQRELAKTILVREVEEDKSYQLLTSLICIPQHKHQWLLEMTIKRLEAEPVAQPVS